MTEAKSNIWGRYSENDIRIIREENRILEMRWEVFEGLYDTTRQELEKAQNSILEIPHLRQQVVELKEYLDGNEKTIVRYFEDYEALQKLCDEAVLENEKLREQVALYINPLKELEEKEDTIVVNEFFNEKEYENPEK